MSPFWVLTGAIVVASLTLSTWRLRRLARARDELALELERQGFRGAHLRLRWLTRGPFPDMRLPGTRHATEHLFRVVARDTAGFIRTGWIRWKGRWPGQAANRWTLRWDDGRAVARGIPTGAFAGMLAAGMAVVLVLVTRVWRFVLQ